MPMALSHSPSVFLPYLVEHESIELEAGINIQEAQNALNSFQNNKTNGDDGFTKEFLL